jgi:hypothetical protein
MTTSNNRERELLTCDFIAEMAHRLIALSSALLASACAADIVAVEADLWRMRLALMEAIATWRETVPGHKTDGGAP